jgi:hypothetical protein
VVFEVVVAGGLELAPLALVAALGLEPARLAWV